jgi:hypothetical protein
LQFAVARHITANRKAVQMKRFANWFGGVGLAMATVALLAGCTKTAEDESMVEYLEGNANEVTFLVGVNGNPDDEAKAHCALYGKQAVIRDVETAGTDWESYTTGSRPYLYHFDCL